MEAPLQPAESYVERLWNDLGDLEQYGLPPIQWTGKCLSFVSVPHPRWSQKLPLRQRRRGVEGS